LKFITSKEFERSVGIGNGNMWQLKIGTNPKKEIKLERHGVIG
jgi:hypothetical protein